MSESKKVLGCSKSATKPKKDLTRGVVEMASIHALTAHLVPDEANSDNTRAAIAREVAPTRASAQESYYIEDGWVFREHHGKYVECICRTEEIPAVPALKLPLLQHR